MTKTWIGAPGGTKTSGVWLDYGTAATEKLLGNISAVAAAGRYLWTASDEGRTVECLEPRGNGFRLREQVGLDRLFASLPGREGHDEVDLELLSISGGRIWLCGSHCRVRKNRTNLTRIDERIVDRPSRCLLGALPLLKKGGGLAGEGAAFPWQGAGSVRALLAADPYIAPFVELPSKENGLDIEGLCVLDEQLFLGLRGPVVDSIALVAELTAEPAGAAEREKPVLHFLNLGGLGVRDLASVGRSIVVLAGPVSAVNGPFRLYRWRPKRRKRVQNPRLLRSFQRLAEHPEGICLLERQGRRGLLVVYDSPDGARIKKSRYRADWISLAKLGLA